MTTSLRTGARLAGAATASLLLALPAPALAEERTCAGSIGAETVDNLRVPEGATCTLDGTSVKGTITVQRSATLRAGGIQVVGNVQAENAADVVVAGAKIGGSVQVKQGGGADVSGSEITGDVQYDANASRLNVAGNRVNGNVQIVGNRGQASVYDNTIGANLQCKENSPAPAGGRNVVKGSAEDQCAAFTGTPAPAQPQRPDAAPAQRVSFTVRRRARRLVVSGRAQPDSRATLQVRRDGRWRALKRFRTSSSGAYRTSLLTGRKRKVLRVVVAGEASRTRTIR